MSTAATTSQSPRRHLACIVETILSPPHVGVALMVLAGASSDPSALHGAGIALLAGTLACLIPEAVLYLAPRDATGRRRRGLALALVLILGTVAAVLISTLAAPRPLIAVVVSGVGGIALILAASRIRKLSIHSGSAAGAAVLAYLLVGPWALLAAVPIAAAAFWARLSLGEYDRVQIAAGAVLGVLAALISYRLIAG